MTKLEIYEYIQKNRFRIGNLNGGGGFDNIKLIPIFKELKYDFKNEEDLYNYLIEPINLKCRLEECNNKKRFISFSGGYRDFCSDKCRNEWLSISRKGSGNPIHRISDENRKKWKATLSKQVNARIKAGTWTPGVTNSWCHSKYNITFYRNNELIHQRVRSSWEAFFQIINPELEYEKLRIPYFYNKWHVYIVDFIDNKNKIVYELKPNVLTKTIINIVKENALKDWCKYNKFKYIKITEDYFKNIIYDENLFKDKVLEYDKLKRFKIYFKNEN